MDPVIPSQTLMTLLSLYLVSRPFRTFSLAMWYNLSHKQSVWSGNGAVDTEIIFYPCTVCRDYIVVRRAKNQSGLTANNSSCLILPILLNGHMLIGCIVI